MLLNLYLLWGAWQDLRKRKITNSYLWFGGIWGMVRIGICFVLGTVSFIEWIQALIPGVLFLLIAKMTGEKIGMGDGWVIMIIGNFLNIRKLWYVVQVAITIVFLFSIIMLCSKKKDKEYQIPFLPFLWMGHTFMWGIAYV